MVCWKADEEKLPLRASVLGWLPLTLPISEVLFCCANVCCPLERWGGWCFACVCHSPEGLGDAAKSRAACVKHAFHACPKGLGGVPLSIGGNQCGLEPHELEQE